MSDNTPGTPGEPEDLGDIFRRMMGSGDMSDNPEFAEALQSMGLSNVDPATLQAVQAQIQAMMNAPTDGSFDVAAATDVARKTVAAAGDSSVSASTIRDVEQVGQVANLWLDAVTDFSATSGVKAWSRAEWVEATMPMWRQLVEPVATGVGNAIQQAMTQQLRGLSESDLGEMGLPSGVDPSMLMGQMEPMVARMSSAMFGMQVGQAVGALAGDLVSGTEVGLPLVEGNPVVMLPANVSAFAEGLGLDAGEIHLYLAVREAARVRLFNSVGWLSPALIAAVQSYAADIRIDTDRIEESLRSANTQDPAAMQEALQNSLFSPDPSPEQQRALAHLETLLALVEGWVDVVSERAVAPHLPNANALSEAVRRRRASGGPAERVFASLVGLELRPRRLREAATLFAQVEDALGSSERDESWKHPDFAPTSDDLDNPQAYLARRTGTETEQPRDEIDDALDKLLAQGQAELNSERDGKPDNSSDDKPGDAS